VVSQIQTKTSELRAFDSLKARGFLLSKQAYQENDLIVDLLLENKLRISAIVRGGQKSIKRFGGKLEPLQLLQFQLRTPPGIFSYERLFSLEAADVVEIYSGYRASWDALNEGLFYTELMRELLLKGESEEWVFRSCLRILKIANDLVLDREALLWRKIYVWSYFAQQMGFGILGERGLLNDLLAEDFEEWNLLLLSDEIFSEKAICLLSKLSENVLDKKIFRDLYSDWIQRSHLKCRSLEAFMS
jgi:hypothetical protein